MADEEQLTEAQRMLRERRAQQGGGGGGSAPGTAVAPAADLSSVSLTGPIADLGSAKAYAREIAGATSVLPNALRGKPNDVLAIILYGQQLGLTPMQAIQGIYVVNGKPQISGNLWIAKVREAGHQLDVKHSEPAGEWCEVTITRKGTDQSHTETFTIADARRAGLATKDIWKSYPKRMLMWRAVSDCATVICPEVALGFGSEEPPEDGGGSNAAAAIRAHATATRVDPAHGAPVASNLGHVPPGARRAPRSDADIAAAAADAARRDAEQRAQVMAMDRPATSAPPAVDAGDIVEGDIVEDPPADVADTTDAEDTATLDNGGWPAVTQPGTGGRRGGTS